MKIRKWPTRSPEGEDPPGGSPGGGETTPAAASTLEVVGDGMADHVDPGGNPDRVGAGADEDESGAGENTESGASTEAGDDGAGKVAGEAGGDEPVVDPKPKTRVPWQQQRIDRLTKEKNAEAAERQKLAEENERLRLLLGGGQTEGGGTETGAAAKPAVPPAASHLVNEKGERLYTQAELDQIASRQAHLRTIDEKVNALHDAAAEADPKFAENVKVVAQAFSDELRGRVDFFEALTEVEEGAGVMSVLWADPDRLAEVLTLPAHKLGIEMAKLSAEVKAKKTPRISNAPKPVTTLKEKGTVSEDDLPYDDPNLSMDSYSKRREKERAARSGR